MQADSDVNLKNANKIVAKAAEDLNQENIG